jgi:hypothetical protein
MLVGLPIAAQKVISPSLNAPAPLQPPLPSIGEAQRPPQEQSGRAQEPSQSQQRGAEDNPLIVKVLPTEKTEEERAQERRDHDEKAMADRWIIRLTGALVGVGVLQFLAFVGQIIVFVIQAKRLRDSVEEMRKATAATEKAIIAAQMSASATDRTATAMEDTAERQLRAYITVEAGGILTWQANHLAHARVTVKNLGATPAYDV